MKKQHRMHRAWINQPSSLQPLHHMHGTRVIATADEELVYPVTGDIVSLEVPKGVLSPGWPV